MKKLNIGYVPGNGKKYCLLRVSPYDNYIVIGKSFVTGEETVILDKDTAERGPVYGDSLISSLLYAGYCRTEIDFNTPYVSFGPYGIKILSAKDIGDKAQLLTTKIDEKYMTECSTVEVSREEFLEMINPKEGENLFYISDSNKILGSIELPLFEEIISNKKKSLENESKYYLEREIPFENFGNDAWINCGIKLEIIHDQLYEINEFESGKKDSISIQVEDFSPLYILKFGDENIVIDELHLTTINNNKFSLKKISYLLNRDIKKEKGLIKK